MSLVPLEEKVGKLWTALHTKAKAEPSYRFYALYDKLYRPDVLIRIKLQWSTHHSAPAL